MNISIYEVEKIPSRFIDIWHVINSPFFGSNHVNIESQLYVLVISCEVHLHFIMAFDGLCPPGQWLIMPTMANSIAYVIK